MIWLLSFLLSVTVLFNQGGGGGGSPAITLTAPNGGESLTGTVSIQWNTDTFGADTIKIEMSRDGTTWETLFASTTNDSTENWTAALPSGPVTFRVCGVTNSSVCDSSDAAARIRGRFLY